MTLAGSIQMAEGSDIVALALKHNGERYVLGSHPPLENRNWQGPWDCSTFASWLTYQAYGILYGCGNIHDPKFAHPYTGNWAKDVDNRGIEVSVDQAISTPGAVLLRRPAVSGAEKGIGHIAISKGDGTVIEAAGRAFGVRVGLTAGRRWDKGVELTGVEYRRGHTIQQTPNDTYILRFSSPTAYDDHVVELQLALKEHNCDPGAIDGKFGEATEAAVATFQSEAGLISDGEVGPVTGRALGLSFWPDETPTDTLQSNGGPPPPPAPASDIPHDSFGAVVNKATDYPSLKLEYETLFRTCTVIDRHDEVAELARRILTNRTRYAEFVRGYAGQRNAQMPWYFVAVLHAMEASGDVGLFRTHLHNGDPLTRPTVHVPAGRPDPNGRNFTWEESARDAVHFEHLDMESDWSLARMLYRLEAYNGMGARKKGHATAYLWSYSNQYSRGKYIADNVWSDEAVSRQPGAAVILKQVHDISGVA